MVESLPRKRVEAMLDAARSFPHVADDWAPSMPSKIRKIVYAGRKNFDLKFNLKMARDTLLAPKDHWLGSSSLFDRLRMTAYMLAHVETNAPDAELFGGSIICYWGEHADYLEHMDPPTVEAALRELLALRAFREAVGYVALSLDPEQNDASGTAVPTDAYERLCALLEESPVDWIEDPSLTRAEKLERFEALTPEPTRGPKSYREVADLEEARERMNQVKILAEGWRVAADNDLITSDTLADFARTAADALEAALRGETAYGKPQVR